MSPLKDITFKVIMVMLSLLLQKPSQKSKSKGLLKSLENQIKLWHAGATMEMLKEAETIQKGLRVFKHHQSLWKYLKCLLMR